MEDDTIKYFKRLIDDFGKISEEIKMTSFKNVLRMLFITKQKEINNITEIPKKIIINKEVIVPEMFFDYCSMMEIDIEICNLIEKDSLILIGENKNGL